MPGLNVLIGPRGVGKTTLLELIGHALGTGRASRDSEQQQRQRVRAMLGDGEVVLDVEDGETTYRLVVDADGAGRRLQASGRALMLGQNELEAIASDRESRLRLIDFRSPSRADVALDDGEIQTLTTQLYSLRQQIDLLEERTQTRPLLEADLQVLEVEEAGLMVDASATMTVRRDTLRGLEDQLIAVQSESAQAVEAIGRVQQLQQIQRDLSSAAAQSLGISLASADQQRVRPLLTSVSTAAKAIGDDLGMVLGELERAQTARASRGVEIRSAAEPLRTQLDEAEKGLGELTARIRRVRTELEQLQAEQARLNSLREQHSEFLDRRERLLDRAELAAEQLFNDRLEVAAEVSHNLSSRVTVMVEHLADATSFRDFLNLSLRQSGLRYASIVESIAKGVLPRQLLLMIENFDIETAARVTELPADRILRAFEHLNSPEILADLSAIQLGDVADFMLMDGSMLKSVESLSTGQKCAVTLPILLTEHTRLLILDQPEDHLDNAFLVDSVVVSLNKRSGASAQTIIGTRIPFLYSS